MEVAAKVTNLHNPRYRPGGGAFSEMVRDSENLQHLMRIRLTEIGEVGVLKFPWFIYDVGELYSLSGKIRKHDALNVDLRGNHGR